MPIDLPPSPARAARPLLAVVLALGLALAVLPALPRPVVAQEGAAPAAAPDHVIQPWLAEQLATARPGQRMHVMVHAADAGRLADALDAVTVTGMQLQSTWDRIGVAVAIATPAQIRLAATLPGVVYLEGNQPLAYHMDTSHVATRGALARQTLVDADGAPIDGTGVSIGIVDSGVEGDHPMFRLPDGSSKVRRNLEINPACNFLVPQPPPDGTTNTVCLVDNPTNNTDATRGGGHGTHVAGTAAGVDVTTADGRELHGAAPGATLISFATGGAVAVLGANHGLNWILEHHANPCAGNGTQPDVQTCPPIRSTNHSYGPVGGGEFDPASATTRLQDALAAEGVVTSWAAGNDGGDGSADMVSPQAKNPTPGVIGVAAYDDGDVGTREGATSGFSSRGEDGDVASYPDISAPGTAITSACRPNLPVCNSFEADLDYGTIGGTSMATPHIAGIVAQLLQADPDLTPAQVEQILEDTAHQFAAGADYEPDLADRNDDHTTSYDKGHGLVDAAAAVATALGQEVPAPPDGEELCVPGQPQLTDPRGDATTILGIPALPINQSALDVLSARLTSDPQSSDVTFAITVDDLPATPGGTTGDGEHFDFTFTYGGASFYLTMARTVSEGESFTLGDFGGPNGLRRTLVAGLEGSFDPEADVISAVLPAGAIASVIAGAPVIDDGAVIAGLGIVSRYSLVFVVPDADTATGACPYVVGSEHTIDPDAPLQLTIRDVTTGEGDVGTTDFVFDVHLSRAADGPVTVDYATGDGSATAGSDYAAGSGEVAFEPGEVVRSVTIPVSGDAVEEPDEDFVVTLSGPGGAVVLDDSGVGTILDDDGPPTINVGDVTVTEPDDGSRTATFDVALSRPTTTAVTAAYATADGTATAGSDYTAASGTVTIPAGQTTATIPVPVLSDDDLESAETFSVELSDPDGARLGRATGTGTIDDSGPIRLGVDDPAAGEGDEGTEPLGFTITASAAAEGPIRVVVDTADGTATVADDDYEAVAGRTVTLPAGSRAVLAAVDVLGDATEEADETLALALRDAEGAVVDAGTGTGTIRDDDGDDAGPGPGGPVDPPGQLDQVVRAAGGGRVETAVELSRSAFPGGAPAAVLARADDFPDALAAVTLAVEVGGPLLLSDRDALSDATAEELERLGVTQVHLVGGEAALTASVADAVADVGAEPLRVGGADRFATAALIAGRVIDLGGPVEAAIVARGDDFADALAAGSLAAQARRPILLTSRDALAEATAAVLAERMPDVPVTVAGGTAAITAGTAQALREAGHAVDRAAGTTRYGTAVALVDAAVAAGAGRVVTFAASGANFPDALAAAPAAAAAGGVLILIHPTALDDSPEVRDWLLAHREEVDAVVIAGGTAAVSEGVATAVQAAIADGG